MKIFPHPKQNGAITLIELLVVLAVLAVVGAFVLNDAAVNRNVRNRAIRFQCVNNLKAIGNVFRVWADDNNGSYPMSVSQTNGGTSEFITGPNAWCHFQVMSNELSTPKVLVCPADWLSGSTPVADSRVAATNFTAFNNSNLSLFVGIDARETNSAMFLSGDRNITNGLAVKNGLLDLTTTSADWTAGMHNKQGNILFADGSVRVLDIPGLRTAATKTGLATNRLQMPTLTP